MNQATALPLSDIELNELDRFLASDATSDETMMIDAIDGFLTALVIGPGDVPPPQWLPVIWGPDETHAPRFASPEQEARITELLQRHGDGIRWALDYDPDAVDPVFDIATYQDKSKEYLDGEMWAYGFMQGVALVGEAWQPAFDDAAIMDALMPIYVLGADDVTAEQRALANTPAKREALTQQIEAGIGKLWRFWHPDHQPQVERMATPIQRAEPKVGRNDPCPCGSGKKWKKCCGAH